MNIYKDTVLGWKTGIESDLDTSLFRKGSGLATGENEIGFEPSPFSLASLGNDLLLQRSYAYAP